MSIELLLIAALATYRLSLLISKEAGPFDMMGHFRTLVGVRFDTYSNPYATGQLSEMILCPFCLSVWIGIGITLYIGLAVYFGLANIAIYPLLPFGLSGLAVFLFRYAGT